MVSVTKNDGSEYESGNWRLGFVGREGWLEIQNHPFIRHTVIFSELKDAHSSSWAMETSIVWTFTDLPDGVCIGTNGSRYIFEYVEGDANPGPDEVGRSKENAIDRQMKDFRITLQAAVTLLFRLEEIPEVSAGEKLWDRTIKEINNFITACPEEERARIDEWLHKYQDDGLFPDAMGVIILTSHQKKGAGMENESKTKEVAKKKWDEIKRYKAMDLDEMLQEIVITDSDIMHDDEELDL